MAPERCGMLAVLDLHFQNGRVISETQVITADTDHEKFYVDWTCIERPEGYSEVAGGVAYIRDEPPATWTPKKTQELQPSSGAYSYIWGNQVKGNLSWLLLVLILPEGRRLGKFKPMPIRMRAKVFKNRLVLIIWVSAETNYFEGTLELKKLKRALQFEAKLKNNLYLPKRPVIQDIIRDVIVPIHQTDVAILTVLPEEYEAVCSHLVDVMPPPLPHRANLYAWKIGVVKSNVGAYSVAVGMIGRAGTNNSTVATVHALDYWHPRYVFFVGIAGGLGNLSKGDVVVADIIYGYEYGKIERRFVPRSNWTHRTDIGLLNGAMAHTRSNWKEFIKAQPPDTCTPHVEQGEIASGDKVVDDPNNEFFKDVLNTWPKIKAVEMEGIGMADAIEHAHALGERVGFMMIRGISDLPRSPQATTAKDNARGTGERDAWKNYAAHTASAFTVSFIKGGLPEQPAKG